MGQLLSGGTHFIDMSIPIMINGIKVVLVLMLTPTRTSEQILQSFTNTFMNITAIAGEKVVLSHFLEALIWSSTSHVTGVATLQSVLTSRISPVDQRQVWIGF